ncbi:hypothetical protein, partial [Methylocucumis oryzae]|uniref:hypothetical protein n=1 Tax=Methylocucumis oryzae TaxID=1632867 RepID=UPI0019552CD0
KRANSPLWPEPIAQIKGRIYVCSRTPIQKSEMLAKREESIYGFADRQSAISEVHRWRFSIAKLPHALSLLRVLVFDTSYVVLDVFNRLRCFEQCVLLCWVEEGFWIFS